MGLVLAGSPEVRHISDEMSTCVCFIESIRVVRLEMGVSVQPPAHQLPGETLSQFLTW